MKLTTLLLTLALLQVSAKDVYSQINLNAKHQSVATVLQSIKQQTGYVFVSGDIDLNTQLINVKINKADIRQALDLCFKSLSLDYKIVDKTVFIKKKETDFSPDVKQSTIAITVTGRVVDDKGLPIPGASISVKGTNKGTVSNVNGDFTLNGVDGNVVLIISSVGYKTTEITAQQLSKTPQIVLQISENKLNDVVVVGYGTQIKSKVTGAISSVKADYLQSRPITNVSSGLAGAVPGLTVNSSVGGSPGKTPSITIRGTTTLNNANGLNTPVALILVDGVESRLEDVDPNIIQEVTVLKDAAAAAIYGSKAANGVILITTKSGVAGQATKIDYSFNGGTQKLTSVPNIVNSVDYINLKNKALVYEALYFNNTTPPPTPYFSNTILQKAQNGELANTNWANELYKANAFQMNHSLNISGSGNKSDYLIGLGYLDQNGVNVGVDKFTRYNLRAKINTKINNWLTVGTNTAFTHRFLDNLPDNAARDLRASPLFPVTLPDGRFVAGEGGNSGNPNIDAQSGSYNRLKEDILETQLFAKADFGKHFSIEEKFSARIYDAKGNVWNNAIDYVTLDVDANGYQAPIPITALSTNRSYSESNERTTVLISQTIMRYNQSFGPHNVTSLLGFQSESYKDANGQAGRVDYLNGSLQNLALGATVDPKIGGGTGNTSGSTAYKMASVFGRFNYDYKNRYLIEGSFRLDGSSRFTGANQYGFFPSVSVGWNIAEENFVKEKLTFIEQLKLRASVGTLGDAFSGGIGNYDFYQQVNKNAGYTFAGGTQPGLATGKAANPNITWERATITDIGLDLSVLKNKLSVVFDYFVNNRSDILISNPNIPDEFGLPAPSLNGASVRSQGFEIEVMHRNKIGNVSYFVAANLANQSNKVTGLGASSPTYGNMVTDIGYPVKAFYGYVADGFITSKADLAAYTTKYKINGPMAPYVGTVKLKDLNNDNIIDPQNDRTIINDNTPHYNVGFRFGTTYKSLSLSANIVGVLDQTVYFKANESDTFFGGGVGAPFTIQQNFFDPQNVDATLNADFPVLRSGVVVYDRSSFWLRKAAYIRMRNVTLSYELNKNLLKKIGINRLNIYASAENPFMLWTNYFAARGGFDPELGNSGVTYPLAKTFSVGLNLTL